MTVLGVVSFSSLVFFGIITPEMIALTFFGVVFAGLGIALLVFLFWMLAVLFALMDDILKDILR